jgi:bifunctional non-homologous end joining protein LigD
MQDFTTQNAWEKVQKLGDTFKPVMGKGINLKKVLERFE